MFYRLRLLYPVSICKSRLPEWMQNGWWETVCMWCLHQIEFGFQNSFCARLCLYPVVLPSSPWFIPDVSCISRVEILLTHKEERYITPRTVGKDFFCATRILLYEYVQSFITSALESPSMDSTPIKSKLGCLPRRAHWSPQTTGIWIIKTSEFTRVMDYYDVSGVQLTALFLAYGFLLKTFKTAIKQALNGRSESLNTAAQI